MEERELFVVLTDSKNFVESSQKQMKDSMMIIQSLQTAIEAMKEDFEFAQAIKQNEKMYSMKEAADILYERVKLGRNDLFAWLRMEGILAGYGTNYNQPYQTYVDRGYFTIKVKNTAIGAKSVTLVTGKGLDWILKLYQKKCEKLRLEYEETLIK